MISVNNPVTSRFCRHWEIWTRVFAGNEVLDDGGWCAAGYLGAHNDARPNWGVIFLGKDVTTREGKLRCSTFVRQEIKPSTIA